MKCRLLALAAKLVSHIAATSAGTLCVFLFHQPKVPNKLIVR